MIHDFLSTWDLFANTYMAGWLVAALLALVGVVVVARNQVFAGAALAQASTLGIALAMLAGAMIGGAAREAVESGGVVTGVAVGVSILAALLTMRSGQGLRESREAVTGWLFLLGASGSIVVVSHSPHGLEEVQRLLSSSIIGASAADVWVFAALLLVSGLTVVRWWRAMLLWVMDPATAAAAGVRVGSLEVAVAAWLGVCVGLSLRSAGLLYSFGMLVLPALCAKAVVREVRSMFWVAPAVGVSAAVAGFVVANRYDFPPAQLTVFGLCGLLVLAWGGRRLRR